MVTEYIGDYDGEDFAGKALAGALFEGEFEGAIFRSAHLKGASFDGDSNFVRTDFSGANLELAEAFGDFSGANFSGANLKNATFCGARLYAANFRGADLTGTDFSEAHVRGADFGDRLPESLDLAGACAGMDYDPEDLVLSGTQDLIRETDPPTYRLGGSGDDGQVFYRGGKWSDTEDGLTEDGPE